MIGLKPNAIRVGQVWSCDFDKDLNLARTVKVFSSILTGNDVVEFEGTNGKTTQEDCSWILQITLDWKFIGVWGKRKSAYISTPVVVLFDSVWEMGGIKDSISYEGTQGSDYVRWGSTRIWDINDFLTSATEDGKQKDIPKIPKDPKTPAINNHICPTCGNKRCSKPPDEVVCWRCGERL